MDTTSFDLLLEEFESALHQGERPEISRYLERAADSQRSQLLRELIQIELWCRRDEFPLPGESEYRFRFPSDHPIVADAFELFGQRMLSAETMAPASQVTVSQYADDFETQVEDGSEHQRVRLSPDAPKRQFGRYRLLRELGRGGMGVVYLAHDEQLSRELALKIPTFRESVRDEMLTRFYREARAAAALRDPGICPVYDVGEIDGQSFIAMAFIEGRPLRDYTKGGKPHNATKTAWVIRRLAVAMSEAHQANIVHRDLKPANIMMEKGRRPVIMDFGLACSTTEMESSLTGTGAILGTPTYMSPEQAMGETASIGPATDIYSLGIIFYEMLAGRVPFEGNVTAVLTQIATADAKPLSEYGLDIGPAIVAIVSRMMARKVEDRFASMDEVVSELTAYLKEGAPDAEKREANDSVEDDIAPNSQSLQPLFGAVSSSVSAQNDVDQSTVRQTATDAGTTRNRPSPKKKRRPAVQTPDEEFDAVSEYDYDDYEYDVSYRSRHRDPRQSGSRKKSSQSIAVFSPMVLGGVAAGIVVLSGLYFLLFGLATSDSNVTQNRGKSGSSNDSSKSTGGAGQTVSEPSNVNSIGMRFVPIQRGTFTMVEGETAHEVTLTQDFHLAQYEVTQEQYEKVMGSNPSAFKGAQNPVEDVSWDDAVEFCGKLSALSAEKSAGYMYRLPTEAEWEYAYRAGTQTAYSFGDDADLLGEYAWYDDNSGRTTHPVGGKKPNPWDLYDMHGNVYERCQDWCGDYSNAAVTDPQGPTSGSDRVNRGGGWTSDSDDCRSADRSRSPPDYRSRDLGFRVLRSSIK